MAKQPFDFLVALKAFVAETEALRDRVAALEMDNERLRDHYAGAEVSARAWNEKYHELLDQVRRGQVPPLLP